MKRTNGFAGVATRAGLVLLAVGLPVCAGCRCKPQPAPPGFAGRAKHPTHAPPFTLMPDSILLRKADFIHHVTTDLVFDTGTAADERYLLDSVGHSLRVGPHVALAPETGAPDLDSGFAWAGTGRVLAKITIDADYAKLMLKQGVNYVCVVRGASNSFGNMWAILAHIRNNTVSDTARLPLHVKNKTGPARWFTGPTDDNFCVPCDSRYCCTEQ